MKSVRNLSMTALTLLTVLFFSFYGCQKDITTSVVQPISINDHFVETRGTSFEVGVAFLNENRATFSATNPIGKPNKLSWTRKSDDLPIFVGNSGGLRNNMSPSVDTNVYQAHHFIPFNLTATNNPYIRYAALDGFHINAGYNGINLEPKLKVNRCRDDNGVRVPQFTVTFHSRADQYERHVADMIVAYNTELSQTNAFAKTLKLPVRPASGTVPLNKDIYKAAKTYGKAMNSFIQDNLIPYLNDAIKSERNRVLNTYDCWEVLIPASKTKASFLANAYNRWTNNDPELVKLRQKYKINF